MTPLALRYDSDALKGPCGLCGKAVTLAAGLQPLLGEKKRPVCPGCTRRAAPGLAALLGLAAAAERVGRICHHTAAPPLAALLELARAAEDYATSAATPQPCRAAA